MTITGVAAEPALSYLEDSLGLSFSGDRRARLLTALEDERIAARLSSEAFLSAAARPGEIRDRLVDHATVGETYFFRDREQCELLRAVVLPPLAEAAAAGRDVAVWSAGCASGEEAYTLAALAEQVGLAERCTVVGSDVSGAAVAKARTGMYGPWSMRSTTDVEKAAHFGEQDGRLRVSERLRRRVRFLQRNLLDGAPPPGRFDVIVCRNLLIYLTEEGVQRVAAILTGALAHDGWLITAAGDPDLVAPGLIRVRTPWGVAYRRAGMASPPSGAGSDSRVTSAGAPGVSTAGTAAPRRTAPAAPPPARTGRAALRGPADDVPTRGPVRPADPVAGGSAARAAVDRVRSLGDTGRLAEACAAADAAVLAHPLDVDLRYLAGALLLEAGRLPEAAAAATATAYLAPDSPAAHLLLGQVQHAAGELARARRSFRNAARLLAGTSGNLPVPLTAGVPAGHLAAIAQRYLDTLGAPA